MSDGRPKQLRERREAWFIWVPGLIIVLGLLMAAGGYLWSRQPTGENGANIGAGLLVFNGLVIGVLGIILLAVALIRRFAVAHRQHPDGGSPSN